MRRAAALVVLLVLASFPATSPPGVLAGPPGPSYASYLGGSGWDSGASVAVGPDGSIYVAGTTDSGDFPGATTGARGLDVFVTKLSPDGSRVLWTRLLGGGGYESGNAIEVALDGSVYVAGQTDSSDFPVQGVAVHGRAPGGNNDGFLAKLDANGGLVWSEYVAGSGFDTVSDLQIDHRGRVVLVGTSASCDFPTYELSWRPTNPQCGWSQLDAFVIRYWNDGALNRGTFFGGVEADLGFGVAVSQNSGSVMVAGEAMSTDLGTPGAMRRVGDGDDAFVAKFDESLERLLWATYLGGTHQDVALDVARDGAGNAFVVGTTLSSDFPTSVGAYQRSHQSPTGCPVDGPVHEERACSDAFAVKVSPDGARLAYGTYIGSVGEDEARAVTVDTGTGIAWIAGRVANGEKAQIDGFVASVASDGSALLTMTLARGSDIDEANDVALFQGRAFGTGLTYSSDFVTTPDGPDQTLADGEAFLVRVGAAPSTGTFTATFTNVKGNEWWIETKVSGSERVTAVSVSLDRGAWKPLTLQWWGHWARSYHAPPGTLVQFQATSASGATALSGCYQWTNAAPVSCPGAPPPPPPSGTFQATFFNVRGNAWWVETDVAASGGTLSGVDARVNGGSWTPLDHKSWGSWAKSIYAPEGSTVEFRARATDGQSVVSSGYRWPPS